MASDLDGPAIRQELERVLASGGLVRNARMSQFLRFLVERHIEGRDDELKESVIAVEVFSRRPDYDPKLDSIVRTEAARLRSRLIAYYAGDGSSDSVVIDVPKGGYIPVCRRREASQEGPNTRSPQRWIVVALAGAAVALAAIGLWTFKRPYPPIRIAVLPLENLSLQRSSDYFADGLTDEIIRNLSVIDGLTVRSQTSSFALKGRPRNVREAARQLEADYLLEGSVLREGGQLRINVQLIRARDDVPVWSARFDRKLTDVFAIQDEISIGIVNNLRLQLGRGRRRYETSLDAYDLYLRANVLAVPSTVFSEQEPIPSGTPPERYLRSIQSFQAAITKDRAFAPAYAGLASVYAIRSVQFPVDHPPDELSKMRAAAERAIQLDPLLPDAHHAVALVAAREGQWEEAEKGFRRAIEFDPNQSTIYADYAYWLLTVIGRYPEALRQLHAAEKADPLSADVRLTTALVLISAHRYDEAAEYCARLPVRNQCMARVRAGQGRFAEIIELLASRPALLRNPETRGFLGYAYARSGRRAEAEAMATASNYANEQALIFAGLGDKDRTFDALRRMGVLGPQRVGLYLDYPELGLLRGEARVKLLRKSVGLP